MLWSRVALQVNSFAAAGHFSSTRARLGGINALASHAPSTTAVSMTSPTSL